MKTRFVICLLLAVAVSLVGTAWGQDEARINQLIQNLKGFDWSASRAASDELYQIGPPAVPFLIKALENDDPGIRKGAAQVLGDLKVKEAIIPISKLLQDQQYWVVRAAVYALGNTADPAAIPPLQEALKHYHPKVKEAALSSLDELQAKAAMPDIVRLMLTDRDQYVRWKAMTTMRNLEEGAEIKALFKALKDKASGVTARRNAATFLGDLKVEAAVPALVVAFSDQDEGLRWRAVEAVGKIGNKMARPAIEEKLKDPKRDVQMFAISVLGEIGEEKSIPALAALLSSRSPEIKKNVIRSLGRIGGKEAAREVRGMLSDSDKWVRSMAVETLVDLNDKDSVEDIKLLSSDKFPSVRTAVMYALGTLGGEPERLVLEAGLNDTNFWVKQEARRALEKLKEGR